MNPKRTFPLRGALAALSVALPMLCTGAALAAPEAAAATTGEEEDEEYTDSGVFELGGRVGLEWTEDEFTITASPTIGYFVVDFVELSLIFTFDYRSIEDEAGERTSTKSGALIFEPSYHLPLQEGLYLFGGVGVGAGYDGDNVDFELIPRVGLNIGVGRSGVLSPAARVPILVDSDGTTAGFGFEAGYTVAW